MPLGDHLEELRKRIFRTLFYLALFQLNIRSFFSTYLAICYGAYFAFDGKIRGEYSVC